MKFKVAHSITYVSREDFIRKQHYAITLFLSQYWYNALRFFCFAYLILVYLRNNIQFKSIYWFHTQFIKPVYIMKSLYCRIPQLSMHIPKCSISFESSILSQNCFFLYQLNSNDVPKLANGNVFLTVYLLSGFN